MKGLAGRTGVQLAVIVLMGVLAYVNTFSVPFYGNDEEHILENSSVTEIATFFGPDGDDPLAPLAGEMRRRPAGYFTFALDYMMHGDSPAGFHFTNLLAHILAALALFLAVRTIARTPAFGGRELVHAPFVAALLFAVHPAGVEAVTNVYNRLFVLAALWYVLAAALYVRARVGEGRWRGALWYALALGAAALALTTREHAVSLPLALLLIEAVFLAGPWGGRLLRILPFAALCLLPALGLGEFRSESGGVIGGLLSHARAASGMGPSEYMFTEMRALVHYLRMLAVPVGIDPVARFTVSRTFMEPAVMGAYSALVVLFAAALYLIHRSGRGGSPALRLAGFGILWYFVAHLPESSVLPMPEALRGARLYLPMAGIAMAAGAAVEATAKTSRARKAALAAAVGISLLLASVSLVRNESWRVGGIEARSAGVSERGAVEALIRVGQVRRNEGRRDQALDTFQAALRLAPRSATVHYNLGIEHEAAGNTEMALAHYEEAFALDPAMPEPYNNAAIILLKSGSPEAEARAREYLEKAIGLRPSYPAAHNNLGLYYRGRGDSAAAEAQFKAALASSPTDVEAYNNLGVLYAAQGRYGEAVGLLTKAIALAPKSARPHNNMGIVLSSMGRDREAVEEFRAALALEPGYARARSNLGIVEKRLAEKKQ
jgi:tetratricopeptide (TPR) repeat protein